MSTFVGTPLFSNPLWVAMETMNFHIAHTIGVQGNLNWIVLRYLMSKTSFPIILMGKRLLVALLCLSAWCLLIAVWLFFTVPHGCLQFVIVVFSDHSHLLFLN